MTRRDPSSLVSVAQQFRELRNDYDIAKQTRFKRKRSGIAVSGSGADYHYRSETEFLRSIETARDLFRNHALVGQGVRRLVANIVGGGFTLDVRTGDEGLDAELAARWADWAGDPQQCDLAGEQTFHGLERLTLQQTIVDGDLLTLLTRDGALQQVEAHRIRTPAGTTRNVVHGVLLDEFRRRLEYWITRDEIGLSEPVRRVADVERLPVRDAAGRRQVLHHYLPDRTSQTRGMTAFAPAADTAGMGDDLMFAQLVKAQMAACVTILRELSLEATAGVPGQDLPLESETRPDGTVRTIAGWQPGMEIYGFPGEKLMGFSPNVPNAEFFQHALLILTIVAVNLDLPVAVLLLDPSKTNFSGWRGAMDQARQRWQEIQQWQVGSFHSPIYRWKVGHFAADDPAIARLAAAPGVQLYGHRWHPRSWPYIEPVNDAMGDVIQERNLLNSPRRLRAARGLDYEDLVEEIVADRARVIRRAHETAQALNAELGLDLTWKDVALWPMPEGVNIQVGQPTAPPPEAADDGR